MKYHPYILVVFLLFRILPALAQGDIKFKHLSIGEGLSQATVKCILKDSKGYMWFGTRDGLNKYDAYKFTIYRHDSRESGSIRDNFVNDLHEDKQGRIWVATANGLDLLNRETGSFKHYKIDQSPLNVTDIFEDRQGNLWLGTYSGLYLFDRSKSTFRHFTHNSENNNSLINNAINKIEEDDSGYLWIATESGLDRFNPSSLLFTHYVYTSENKRGIQSMVVKTVYKDSKKRIWIGLRAGGVALFHQEDNSFTTYKRDPRYLIDPVNTNSLPHDDILSLIDGPDGQLWVGTENGGLCIFNTEQCVYTTYKPDKNNPTSLSHDAVYSLYRDDQGNMWIGTWAGGVNFYCPFQEKFKNYRKFPQARHSGVEAISEDSEGNIWLGVVENGLYSYNPKKEIFHYYPNPHIKEFEVTVKGIRELNKDTLMMSTRRGGLAIFDKRNATFTHFLPNPDDPYSILGNEKGAICIDREGFVWTGDWSKGLNRFDRHTKRFTNYLHKPEDPNSLAHNRVLTIFEDKSRKLWIGTDGGGLNLFDRKRQKFIHYMHDESNRFSLSHNTVISLYEDSKGNFWVGTGGGGLNLFDKEKKTFQAITQKNGLPNDVINGIMEDSKRNLWLITNRGICRFNPYTKATRNFDMREGILDNEFVRNSCCKASDGTMYFSAYGGLNVFHPDSIKDNPYVPPVYITDFQIFNRSITPDVKASPLKKDISATDEIKISYKEFVFSIEFAALNYTLPEKNQYLYKLEGFDKEWTKVSDHRRATYTNLDPGNYTFKVKAANNDEIWNEQGASLTIIITPPFWKTWWFKILIGFLLGTSAYTWYQIRISGIRKQKEILEQQVKERTAELKEAYVELTLKKEEIEAQAEHLKEVNLEIKDSIRAAQAIQKSILPNEKFIKEYLPASFILYKPKDVVSGDFYWFDVKDDQIILAAVDCTGHGVSGAFMSINGHHLLNQSIYPYDKLSAADILNRLNEGIIRELHQEDENSQNKDGMDIAICLIDRDKKKLQYAGANNPLYLLRDKEIIKINANRFSVGLSVKGKINLFANRDIELQKGDLVYLFSDGYADQLGGETGEEKFMYGRFRELLLSISDQDMELQLRALDKAFEHWKGLNEQLDDVLVIGFKI